MDKELPENIHKNHRERMRTKVLANGFENMHEHEILEVMLYNVITRKDTNPIAHALIKRFGSIKGVFCAPVTELTAVEDVGLKTAQYLKILGDFVNVYTKASAKPKRFVIGSSAAELYLHEIFKNEKREIMYMFCLDVQNRIIAEQIVGEGDFGSVNFNTAVVTRAALRHDPAFVVLAHNHPSGSVKASPADEVSTAMLREAFKAINVRLTDNVIVTDDAIYGIISGYMADGFCG